MNRILVIGIERLIEISGMEWTFLTAPAGRHVRRKRRHFWGPQIRAGDIVRWPYLNAALFINSPERARISRRAQMAVRW
jgi:hypothetical protein